jgi:hypothetical protein
MTTISVTLMSAVMHLAHLVKSYDIATILMTL